MLQAEERFQPIDAIRTAIKDSERRLERSMPITISEDSDDDCIRPGKPRRCLSLPTYFSSTKSIMKRRTLDESLHSTYGSEDGLISRKHLSLQFDKINIREYSRTVGDNPSCSSGPPIRYDMSNFDSATSCVFGSIFFTFEACIHLKQHCIYVPYSARLTPASRGTITSWEILI